MSSVQGLHEAALRNVRVLMFRASGEDLFTFKNTHLCWGLFVTWLVGVGRWWDDPEAGVFLHLGLGSLLYTAALSLIIWLITLPLKPRHWSYRNVFTFVTYTSAPGLLYAIPVERFFPLATAATINVWFLAIVATWRVLLYAFFLSRSAELRLFPRIVATLLPLSAIVTTLFVLNLERAVFNIMGGLRPPTQHDGAYQVLFMLVLLATVGFFPLLFAYFVALRSARKESRNIQPIRRP